MTKIKLPDGFELYHGGEIPVDDSVSHVELLIDTGAGIGTTGVIPRRLFESGKGSKAIKAFRLSYRGDRPHFHAHERWHPSKAPKPIHVRAAEELEVHAEMIKKRDAALTEIAKHLSSSRSR